MLKKANVINSKILKEKYKVTFYNLVLVLDDNGKQNPVKFYTNKYQNHMACSYGYKLVCFDDKSSKPLKRTLAKQRGSFQFY